MLTSDALNQFGKDISFKMLKSVISDLLSEDWMKEEVCLVCTEYF